MRAIKSNLQDVPPVVPPSLRELFKRVDPAMMPYREPSPRNPFWGKKICACCGADDKLVRWSYSEEFLTHLVVAPPAEQRESLEIFVQPNTGHTVTDESACALTSAPYRCVIRRALVAPILVACARV